MEKQGEVPPSDHCKSALTTYQTKNGAVSSQQLTDKHNSRNFFWGRFVMSSGMTIETATIGVL